MSPDRLGYKDVSSNDQKIFVTFNLLKVKLTYTKTFLNLKANCGHDYKAKTIKKQTYAKHRSVPRYLNTT